MGKWMFFALILYSAGAAAMPARLQGFSYRKDDNGAVAIRQETIDFDESYNAAAETEPTPPHYLNEDGTDARTGVTGGGDKYTLSPVVPAAQELYDRQDEG
ncbi:MAG: hypothetical protein LBO78_04060, partial [Rickettsiales bacterium]|nr:hypothetical protein [Rickettsiales bacterium]